MTGDVVEVFFSIIIPFGSQSPYIDKCIVHCLNQGFRGFEIIVLPDSGWKPAASSKKIRVFPTGSIGPAEKRDIGAKKARGKFLAFIDDDAFPEAAWLENAKKALGKKKVSAVCGPAVLATGSFMQKAGTVFYSSKLGSGPMTYRYVPERERLVDDYPSSNFIIQKKLFLGVGGFGSKYYPGEDSMLCQKVVGSGHNIFYSPKIKVRHYTRPTLEGHLKQVFLYGLHRGFFVKKFLKNSLRPHYFAPLGFLVFWLFFAALLAAGWLRWSVFAGLLLLYYFLIFVSVKSGFILRLFAPILFFMSHLSYGAGFLSGLLKGELER